MRPPQQHCIGSTLIEIVLVALVIAVLASMVAPNVFKHVGEAKNVTARSQVEMLGAALDPYRLDNGRYPTTAQGLAALWQTAGQDPRPPSWKGPYLRKEVPLDPWGRPYAYTCPGQHNPAGYDLVWHRADGQPGGDGEAADVVSWE